MSVNLYVTATWRGISVRPLSLAIVAVSSTRFHASSACLTSGAGATYTTSTPGRIRNWRLLFGMNCNRSPPASPWPWGLLVWCSRVRFVRKIRKFATKALRGARRAFHPDLLRQFTVGEPGEFWVRDVQTVSRCPDFLLCLRELPRRKKTRPRPPALPLRRFSLAYLGQRPPSWHFSVSSLPLEWVVTSLGCRRFCASWRRAAFWIARSFCNQDWFSEGRGPLPRAWRIIFSAPAIHTKEADANCGCGPGVDWCMSAGATRQHADRRESA